MTTTTRAALFVGVALLFSRPAASQTTSLAPRDPKRWDVTASAGWLAGDKRAIAENWNDWYDTFAGSIDVGRYWTPHLKTEAGVTLTTEGQVFAALPVPRPGDTNVSYRWSEHHFQLKAAQLSASYQFLENTWVHPFATAGVQLGWEHGRIFSPPQMLFGGAGRPPVSIPAEDRDLGHTFSARPFAGGGFKFYVNERAFIRTDLTAAAKSDRVAQAHWRIGFGVDF